MIDTPFCIEDRFWSDLESFITDSTQDTPYESDDEWVMSRPDDWTQEVELCTSEKMFQLDDDDIDTWVGTMLDQYDDRLSEDDNSEEVTKAFKAGIDLAKINAAMPELYYPNGTKYTITKQDLLDTLLPKPF